MEEFRALTTDVAGVDGEQVCILLQAGLGGFLQSKNHRTLEVKVGLDRDETLEGKLAVEKMYIFLCSCR